MRVPFVVSPGNLRIRCLFAENKHKGGSRMRKDARHRWISSGQTASNEQWTFLAQLAFLRASVARSGVSGKMAWPLFLLGDRDVFHGDFVFFILDQNRNDALRSSHAAKVLRKLLSQIFPSVQFLVEFLAHMSRRLLCAGLRHFGLWLDEELFVLIEPDACHLQLRRRERQAILQQRLLIHFWRRLADVGRAPIH